MKGIIKRMSTLLSLLCITMVAFAQINNPVKCKTTWEVINDSVAELRISTMIDAGWHVYSTELEDGPTAAVLVVETIEGMRLNGKLSFDGEEIAKYDEMFGMEVRYFENQVTFRQRFVIEKTDYKLEGYFQYGACDDENCMPPTDVTFKYPKQ